VSPSTNPFISARLIAFAGLAKKAIAKHETSKKITGQVLKRIMFRLCELQKKRKGEAALPLGRASKITS
jgi:hypothetical protein